MEIRIGDIVTMKKPHPCGEKRWLVAGSGESLTLRCLTCGHEITVARCKAEKSIRSIQKAIQTST